MNRGLFFSIKVAVLILVCAFSGSGILMAQSVSQEELRQLVWGAAKEIENGNIDLAKQMLNEVSVLESTPDDVAELIEQLRSTIENLESTQKRQAQNTPNASPSEQNTTSGMSREELQVYLEELSEAVGVLFDAEKSQ